MSEEVDSNTYSLSLSQMKLVGETDVMMLLYARGDVMSQAAAVRLARKLVDQMSLITREPRPEFVRAHAQAKEVLRQSGLGR